MNSGPAGKGVQDRKHKEQSFHPIQIPTLQMRGLGQNLQTTYPKSYLIWCLHLARLVGRCGLNLQVEEGLLPLGLSYLLTQLLGSESDLEGLVSQFRCYPCLHNKELWTEHGFEVKSVWIQSLSAKAELSYLGQIS